MTALCYLIVILNTFFPTAFAGTCPLAETNSPSTLVEQIQAYISERQYSDDYSSVIINDDGFPLDIPVETDLNIPEYYNGYVISVYDNLVAPEDGNFIAINYQYKLRQGGGANAYAAHYGWRWYYDVVVIYELEDHPLCTVTDIDAQVADLYGDDGVFVVTTGNDIVTLADYLATTCLRP